MTNVMVMPVHSFSEFDEIATLLGNGANVIISPANGERYVLPDELVVVLQRAAAYMARGKAVVVVPQSMQRFA